MTSSKIMTSFWYLHFSQYTKKFYHQSITTSKVTRRGGRGESFHSFEEPKKPCTNL